MCGLYGFLHYGDNEIKNLYIAALMRGGSTGVILYDFEIN